MRGPLNERIQLGWQVFQFRAFSDHWLQSGRYIQMVQFKAICAHCGKPFVALATQTSWRKRKIGRRCEFHRRPGKPVNDLKPPIKLSALPSWARPNKNKIRTTSRKMKPVIRTKRSETTASALNRTPRPKTAPGLSYLD